MTHANFENDPEVRKTFFKFWISHEVHALDSCSSLTVTQKIGGGLRETSVASSVGITHDVKVSCIN